MKKVLIVEDQRMPRENMERILLDSGKYALSASVNGADVLLQEHLEGRQFQTSGKSQRRI